MSRLRVAAAQFTVGSDVGANMRTCVRMVATAAGRGAELIVLPAYCNHPENYVDREHAARVACRIGGEFLETVAAAAVEHEVHLKLHVTLADGERITGTNLLFDPFGDLVARSDAHALTASEQRWLDPVVGPGPVVDTPIGRLAMFAGSDGALPDLPRQLAVDGAQILLASLNSDSDFAPGARLHLPVRAAENRVWVVAANAAESTVYGPDGGSVARAPRLGEAVAVANIEPGWADDKTRPDGGDLFLARRPRLYSAGRPPGTRPPAAETTRVAVLRPDGHGMAAIEDAGRLVRATADDGVALIVLPELFHYADGRADGSFLDGIAVDVVCQALDGTDCHVVTSLPDDAAHVGVLIGPRGVIGRQVQMHPCGRHVGWQATLGDRLVPLDLPWGRLVIAVGDDALFPEVFALAVRLGADAVAVPCAPAERWELTLGLPARAAEYGLNIVASAHAGPGGGGTIVAPGRVSGSDPPGGGSLTVRQVPAGARRVVGVIHPERSRSPLAPTVRLS